MPSALPFYPVCLLLCHNTVIINAALPCWCKLPVAVEIITIVITPQNK